MKKFALILAGGEGKRAGSEMPKQFVELLGIPMLWWSVRAFHSEDPNTEISVVLHPGFFADWDIMLDTLPEEDRRIKVRLVAGGRSRGESVTNGLMNLQASDDDLIAVHDAARPLIDATLVSRGWQCAQEHLSAVPVVSVTDSLRRVSSEGSVAVDRSDFVAVQTPQVFRADVLRKGYKLPENPEFTDDASRVQAAGVSIALYRGEPTNIKVTNPDDFAIAETLLIKFAKEG